MALIVFIPIFIIYRIKAVPYFIALTQHSLVGDFIAGGRIQMFWPITTQYYGTHICIKSPTNITIEWIMFIAFIIAVFKTHDTTIFNKPHNSNLILAIPTFTVLLPTFLAFPMDVPLALVLPHIAYLILFLTSILVYIWKILTKPRTKHNISNLQTNTNA